jgi:GDPmannose 4,6-dehydratase
MKKRALIFGVTGQDGYYLSKLLLKKGYIVHGVKRKASTIYNYRTDELYEKYYLTSNPTFFMHYGDVTDSMNILELILKIKPHEIYNFAAQSHVQVSFQLPDYSSNVAALGPLRILEVIKNYNKKIKFYQASTSEMYGDSKAPQSEKTPYAPNSPYAVAKLYAFWITKTYRDAYGIFASNGILFNHESPLRGETFVTKKITQFVAKEKLNKNKNGFLLLGNLDAKRDWGHAKDYVEAIWKILQHNRPDDFVISTGHSISVRKFVELCFKSINIKIVWKGKGIKEIGKNKKTGKILIKINKKYIRPNEVPELKGKANKARNILKWKPKVKIKDLVSEMIHYDVNKLKNNE